MEGKICQGKNNTTKKKRNTNGGFRTVSLQVIRPFMKFTLPRITFIDKHITEFNGHTEDKHGIPLMLFERKQDAHTFANELSARLDIQKEHITVKARKYTR
jgi:hypothetical protein